MYYKLQKLGLGPRTMDVGGRTMISVEAAAEWRREREKAIEQGEREIEQGEQAHEPA